MILTILFFLLLLIYRDRLLIFWKRKDVLVFSLFANHFYFISIIYLPVVLTLFYFGKWNIWDYDFLYDISNDYWIIIKFLFPAAFFTCVLSFFLIKFYSFIRKKLARFHYIKKRYVMTSFKKKCHGGIRKVENNFFKCFLYSLYRCIIRKFIWIVEGRYSLTRKIIKIDDNDFLFLVSFFLIFIVLLIDSLYDVRYLQMLCLGFSMILFFKEYAKTSIPILKFLFVDKRLDFNLDKLERKNKISYFYHIIIFFMFFFFPLDKDRFLEMHFRLINIGGFNVEIDDKKYYLILKTKSFYYLYVDNNIIIQPTSKDGITYSKDKR